MDGFFKGGVNTGSVITGNVTTDYTTNFPITSSSLQDNTGNVYTVNKDGTVSQSTSGGG